MFWTPEKVSNIKEREFPSWSKDVLSQMPERFIDMHVHTLLMLFGKPKRFLVEGLVELFYKYAPKITPGRIGELFPGKDIDIIGLPLPYAEAEPDRTNGMLVDQGISSLLLDDTIKNLKRHLTAIGKGVKMHHKIANTGQGFLQMATQEKMEFLEKNKLCLLIEVSSPIAEMGAIVETANSYDVNIILPHLAFNHTGFHMPRERFVRSFSSHNAEYYALAGLSRAANIYLDVSMKADFDLMKTAMEALGQDRVLYGSDYPYCLTPKFTEERTKGFFRDIALMVGKGVHDWRYEKNLYLLVWVLEKACEAAGADKERVMRKNAEKAILHSC